jgi:transcriptional regulator with XRE-family HTH domain
MKLKDWRAREGVTQAQAASMIGVSVTTISRWESREVVPRQQQLAAIREATGGAVGAVDFVRQGELLASGDMA